jgi:putative ABC transport system permease protein
METIRIAWRNLWRNKRRSLVTIAAMTFALLVMILYSGLGTGMLKSIMSNILDLEMGDIQVFDKAYVDDPSLFSAIENDKALITRLEAAGYRAAPRLLSAGLAAAGDTSAGVTLRGIDTALDPKVGRIAGHVDKGRWLDPGDPGGVVIGRRLAQTLGVKPGGEIVVLSQGADGSMANDLYRVRGVLGNVSDATDRTGVFMTEEAFRELFVFPEGTHQIIVRKPDALTLEAAQAEVRRMAPGLDVKTWRELLPTLANMSDSAVSMVYFMFLLIDIIVAIVMLNAMLMAVFERIRELGILKAIGMSPGGVLRLIIVESLLQTILAAAAGSVLAVPGMMYLERVGIDTGSLSGMSVHGMSWDPVMRAVPTVGAFVGPIIILVVVIMIAVLYPAIKAALIRPVRAIHHR